MSYLSRQKRHSCLIIYVPLIYVPLFYGQIHDIFKMTCFIVSSPSILDRVVTLEVMTLECFKVIFSMFKSQNLEPRMTDDDINMADISKLQVDFGVLKGGWLVSYLTNSSLQWLEHKMLPVTKYNWHLQMKFPDTFSSLVNEVAVAWQDIYALICFSKHCKFIKFIISVLYFFFLSFEGGGRSQTGWGGCVWGEGADHEDISPQKLQGGLRVSFSFFISVQFLCS